MYYFIINPKSRSGKGMKIWDLARERMEKEHLPYKVFFTKYPGHATIMARELAERKEPCTLTVVGGDGTINEVINGLADSDYSHITLGYIQTGSGNDFARGLKLTKNPRKSVEQILHPKQIGQIDIGIARSGKEKRYFVISSGFGFDASICKEAQISFLKTLLNHYHLGKLTYAAVAVKQLLTYKPERTDIRLDRCRIYHFPKCYISAGMNLRYEGGGCKFCPGASCTDGQIDVCIVGNISKLKIFSLLPTAFFGLHRIFRGVYVKRAHEIEFRSKIPLPVHCDGEYFGMRNYLSLKTADRQLSVILK